MPLPPSLWGTSSPKENQANSSQKSCPNHPGKGLDHPPSNGQCPNAFGILFGAASLMLTCILSELGVIFYFRYQSSEHGHIYGIALLGSPEKCIFGGIFSPISHQFMRVLDSPIRRPNPNKKFKEK